MTATYSFQAAITAAVRDLSEHGYDSQERVEYWSRIIREAAVHSMIPEYRLEEQLSRMFGATYRRLVDDGQILKRHPGVARFTLERIKPKLRAELDRRRMASANLIKLNRAKMIEQTVQRYQGWATSVPPGGSDAVPKAEIKEGIRKPLASLPFEERRVHIDQAHKFVANLHNIVATDTGALAARWVSHWRQKNYNYREDHKERDGHIYVMRGNWALERGLMKLDGHQYTDEITMVGEEVFCRCSYTYLYSLLDLPPGMVTDKGRDELRRAKAFLSI